MSALKSPNLFVQKSILKLILICLLLSCACSIHFRVHDDGSNIDRANKLLKEKTVTINYKDGLASSAYHIQIRQDSIHFVGQKTYEHISIPISKIESLQARNHWAGATTGFFLGMVIAGGVSGITASESDFTSLGVFYGSMMGGAFCGLIGGLSGTKINIDFSSAGTDSAEFQTDWKGNRRRK